MADAGSADGMPPSVSGRHVDMVHAIGRVTADARDVRTLVADVLELELAAIDVDVALLHEVDGDRLVLLGLASRGFEVSQAVREFVASMPVSSATLASAAAREGTLQAVGIDAWPCDCRGYAHELGARFAASVPLWMGDRLSGTLTILRRADRVLDALERRLLETSAAQIAAALEHARLLETERRRVAELAAVHEMGRLIAEQLDLESVLAVGVKHLASFAQGANVFVLLLHDDGMLRCVATSVEASEAMDVCIPIEGTSVSAESLRARGPVVVTDTTNDVRVSRTLAQRFGHQAILAIPLLARGEIVGCVTLGLTGEHRAFSPADVELTMAIGNQFAIAIANARLIEDLKSSYAKLERAQRELVEKERLAALGELSAVVAHEVRNPLAIIWNSLGALRQKLRPEGDVATLLEIVREESDRLNRMVADLLDYARPNHAELRPEPLGSIVREAVDAARAAAGGREVDVVVTSPEPCPWVLADARLLRQALVNLVNNAIQAVAPGGRVEVVVRPSARPDAAEVLVRDEGEGLSLEAEARLFQPFFTTKATGTGLGLALVKRIVDAHHGGLAVERGAPVGTVMRVTLPLA